MRPIVLSGPSGGGKSTIISRVMENYPNAFAFSVSHTTRLPRPGEVNGTHYWFVSTEKFAEMIKNNEFLEYATFGGNMYGSSKQAVKDILDSGRICILDVELQGVRNIRKCGLDAKYILIRAPSLAVLEARLRARKTETEDSLQRRLQHAQTDLDDVNANPDLFDVIIINDDLMCAYNEFLKAIQEELEIASKIDKEVSTRTILK